MELERAENRSFSDFGLLDSIVKGLSEMGYEYPTAVQESTIEPALEKHDLIVLSRTGSGKTAAFGIPTIQLIKTAMAKRCLVLSPTRELAVQVETEISQIGKYAKLRSVVVYGKHSIGVEVEKLEKGFDILVGTPGRVLDHIEHGSFDAREFDIVVLDEADRMLDMGFISQVDKIIGKTAKQRTTYLFSATIPDEIKALSAKYLAEPVIIELSSDVKTVEEVAQYHYIVAKNEKRTRLLDVLRHYNPDSCIVFCNTRFEVDRVTEFLCGRGITAKSIHGANSQTLRLKFLNQFKKGEFRVLVATDVAARGLHIEDLELVINYNLPIEKDSYIHRIGRTGRAGKKGLALSFVSDGELFQLYTIEEHAGVMIEELPLPESAADSGRKRHRTSRKPRTAGANNLYGVEFREIGDYDPEGADGNAEKSEKAEAAASDAPKAGEKKKRRRKKKANNPIAEAAEVRQVSTPQAPPKPRKPRQPQNVQKPRAVQKAAANPPVNQPVVNQPAVEKKKPGVLNKIFRIFAGKEKK